MRFSNWPFLFLLLVLPVFHRWWKNRNTPAKVRYSISIPGEVAATNPINYLLWIKYIGIGLLIIGLSRPQRSFRQIDRTVSGVDIMMTLDVSASMNIEDLAERSRLDIAKDTMEDFIKGRQNDRIGFVMFSGEPLTLSPPTLDYGLLIKALHQADTGILKDGTAIGDGLAIALGHLRNSKAKSKVVILLTDGDNNLGQIDPMTAGELAVGYGIKVYTIAIGREGRVKIPVKHRGIFGNVVTNYQWLDNALNPELLQKIASMSQGKFYRVTDESTLSSVFKEIDRLEKSDIQTKEKVRYEEMFPTFLKVGFLSLVFEQLLARGWWRFLP